MSRPVSNDPRSVVHKVRVTVSEDAEMRVEAAKRGHADGRGDGVSAYLRALHTERLHTRGEQT